jgi:predicted DNA-binding transcriptional regulator YafY
MADHQIAFALAILKLLADRPMKRSELILALGDRGFTATDLLQKISRTIVKLRQCGLKIHSAPNRPYELSHSNFPVILSADQQQALSLGAYVLDDMKFGTEAGHLRQIGQLETDLSKVPLKVNFSPPVDYSDTKVQEWITSLQERIAARRRFAIRYRAGNGDENNWDCDRSELRLHNGTLYLFAHVPNVAQRHSPIDRNRIFRVDRLITIHPCSDICWGMPEFPTETFHYCMTGPLAHYKPRRVHEQVVKEKEGILVEIATQESNWFWFRQRLLQYGQYCRLLSPRWAIEQIKDELNQVVKQYELG